MISTNNFTLWAFSDAHVGTDLKQGRESLADAIRQSEADTGFDWHIGVNLGDHSGTHGAPDDDEGREVVRQYRALTRHVREDIYDLGGNHDRSDIGEEEGWWIDTWIDPTGTHTDKSEVDNSKRRYEITGSWERYSFEVGNVLFLMMSDRNEPTHRVPRDEGGGNPSGVITQETFDWWREQVESHPGHIIITAHHYVLKDTTVASGDWEGCWKDPDGTIHEEYHGYRPLGTPQGASYLYWVEGQQDSEAFESYLKEHPGATDLWLAGHTHSFPNDDGGGKRHIESRWGTHFINVSALTRHHKGSIPMSRILDFTPGSSEVTVRCYLHTDDYATEGVYEAVEQTLVLSRPFSWTSPRAEQ